MSFVVVFRGPTGWHVAERTSVGLSSLIASQAVSEAWVYRLRARELRRQLVNRRRRCCRDESSRSELDALRREAEEAERRERELPKVVSERITSCRDDECVRTALRELGFARIK